MQGCTRERFEPCHRVASTYPRRMGNNGRSASRPWKTRSSRPRWLRSSRRSTRRSFWGSAMGSDPGAASTMRWMRSDLLGIAALEDKIVQAAVVAILTPIYEAEFLGFSYGFRPGRSQHDALDALAYGINARKINWILDADISRFFDTLSREWLIRFVEHRIGDRRIIRLIQKWLKAGVLEDGRLIETTEGTPQGSVASPLLANVYLHYVYDLWVEQWRTRHAKGDMIVVRYADDTIVGFQHRQDAERFQIDLTK